jgi:Tol biopolymer transport system component/predicted Ser/Thr protein kinase
MPLALGERLGPYEIRALIGAGGMGEVYRARDTKLDRGVAIKVLPAALAHHPDRLARFEREAKVLAALNHPNIAVIYGLEDNAIVMELVEGPTLADRISAGTIPLEESLKIAAQIAEALEAAHEKGVVHRDLKPANVKVRDDGTVKVLDFGLATAVQSTTGEPGDGANSPTLTMGATEAGVILGTAAYMAPEQARGQRVDKRADIWAFGVVLYEMATGERLFAGATASDILAQVLTKEPDLDRVPAKVRRLLRRCLEKDPKQRLRDIGEARFLLEESPPATAPSQSRLGWVAGALAAALIVSLWTPWRATRPAAPKPLVRLDVDLGSDVSLASQVGIDVILSPDGTRLVYVSRGRLFTRRLDQPRSTELSGTEGAYAPFFSPDGQWIAFFANNKLKKVSVEGGAAIALCDISSARGGSWGEDGNIIAELANTGGLSRIPSTGGAPSPVTELAPGEGTHRWPQILPGGKAVLFTAHGQFSAFDTANIEVVSLEERRTKTLVRGGTFGRYLPSGHLVYVNRGTLFAAPFDLAKLELHGTPVPVLAEVAYSFGEGYALLDFAAASETLVYRSGGSTGGGMVTVQWLDSAGKTQPLLAKPDYYNSPRISPDGQRLAVSTTDAWVYEWQRDTMMRLTFGVANPLPTWSPDGRYIAFRKLGEGLFWTRSDGGGQPQLLAQSKNLVAPFSFTPDGKRLAFQDTNAATAYDLFTIPLENDGTALRAGKPEPFLQTQFNERHPSFSSDGRWLAYASDESGAYQIYVRAFPDKGGKWQISNSGGTYPVFSRNGRELFFRAEDSRIMVAAYAVKGDSFMADKPRGWSEKRIANTGLNGSPYDVAPDGKRIAVLMPAEAPEAQQAQNHVIFLENFFDELRRRVPVGGK